MPMPRLESLRDRVLWSFLAAGLLVGPLVAVAILLGSVELQEWQAERTIAQQLDAVLEDPRAFPLQDWSGSPQVRVLAHAPLDTVPAALGDLPDGLYELETGQDAWLVALGTVDGVTYAVVEDVGAIERREDHVFYYALGGAGLALVLAPLTAAWVARRLTAPLGALAQRVQTAPSGSTALHLGNPGEPTEIRTLAGALERYAERTEAALRREKRFAADVSHELRTPLAVVSNAAELLAADTALAARNRRATERIRKAARRMEETVTSLLALVREPGSGAMADATDVAAQAALIIEQERETSGTGAELLLHRHAEAPTVAAPESVVDVILGNLVHNALVHGAATRIDVHVEAHQVVVVNDGHGFPDSVLAAFEQGGETSPSDSGTGLGLSLVQRLCQHFGWRMAIDNPPEGGARACWGFADP